MFQFIPKHAEAADTAPATSASSAILMEAYSGTVLYEKDADRKMLIASTTKILTALVVIENCDINEEVVIKNDFPAVEGSSIYLKPGDVLTVRDLLYGLLLESGNDAAVALALYTAGSIEGFSELMNAYAQKLGCEDSHFVNPHGLDAKEHFSTARDLATISSVAMQNRTFCEIASTKYINVEGRHFKNHNKLLWNYPGCIGIKTGYTESAGRSLVSCADRNGLRLICVTLSAPNDWNDHTGLFNWAFNAYSCIRISKNDTQYGQVSVISGKQESVSVFPAEDFVYIYSIDDNTELAWEKPTFVYAPVTKGTVAGRFTVKKNGETVKEIPLLYGESVLLDESIPLDFFERLKWSLFHEKTSQAFNYGNTSDQEI